MGDYGRLTKAQLFGLIWTAYLEHGIPFIRVKDIDETIEAVQALERWSRRLKHGALKGRPGPKRDRWGTRDSRVWLEFLVQGMEGVGPGRAANIVDHFTTGLDEVLAELPELRVKIEHLARPDIDEKPPYLRFRRMLKLARFPNTYLNIDGFYAFRYPTENDPEGTPVVNAPPYDPYLPFVRLACDAFGPHRLMWGSDFPFTLKVNGYNAGLPFICHSCGFLTAEEKELILGKTAMRVYAMR